jgi:16S rRNA (adenine1518-N6/adenine1519-N6)-dimethyltransferase
MPRPPLRKALGQHHLRDGALCRPLVDFLCPAAEPVVEVGPGGGVLTRELLRAGGDPVFAWELDPAWAADLWLRARGWEAAGRLRLVVGDALEIPWHRFPSGTRVAGNLPYNIATRLIRRLLPAWRRIPRAAFLVQREVAERLVSGPGDPAYGALSVEVAAYAEARLLARVRRGSFHPPPKVEGAFVGLALHPPPLSEDDMIAFLGFVRLAFGQRRKTLVNALATGRGREGKETARQVVAAAGLETRVRAEALRLEELVALWKTATELGFRGGTMLEFNDI